MDSTGGFMQLCSAKCNQGRGNKYTLLYFIIGFNKRNINVIILWIKICLTESPPLVVVSVTKEK